MNIKKMEKVRVFELKENDKRKNTVSANISSYEGKSVEGDPLYSSWNANFVGDAYGKAKDLKEGQLIYLIRSKIENNYNKEQKKLYVNVTVFDFEASEGE